MYKIINFFWEDNFVEFQKMNLYRKLVRFSDIIFDLMIFMFPFYAKNSFIKGFDSMKIPIQIFLFSFMVSILLSEKLTIKTLIVDQILSAIVIVAGVFILIKTKTIVDNSDLDNQIQDLFYTLGYIFAFSFMYMILVLRVEFKRRRIVILGMIIGILLAIIMLLFFASKLLPIWISICIIIPTVYFDFYSYRAYHHNIR